jgi:hypothetical protein
LTVTQPYNTQGNLTILEGNATFTSIVCNTLTIGAGSTVTLAPIPGGPLGGGLLDIGSDTTTANVRADLIRVGGMHIHANSSLTMNSNAGGLAGNITSVPEPGTMTLLLVGMAALLIFKRRLFS